MWLNLFVSYYELYMHKSMSVSAVLGVGLIPLYLQTCFRLYYIPLAHIYVLPIMNRTGLLHSN